MNDEYNFSNAEKNPYIMSIPTSENHMARMEIHDKIMQGLQQSEEGKLIDGEKAMETLRSKYVR